MDVNFLCEFNQSKCAKWTILCKMGNKWFPKALTHTSLCIFARSQNVKGEILENPKIRGVFWDLLALLRETLESLWVLRCLGQIVCFKWKLAEATIWKQTTFHYHLHSNTLKHCECKATSTNTNHSHSNTLKHSATWTHSFSTDILLYWLLNPRFVFYCNNRLKLYISDIYWASPFE